jgi:hypothetical protein
MSETMSKDGMAVTCDVSPQARGREKLEKIIPE